MQFMTLTIWLLFSVSAVADQLGNFDVEIEKSKNTIENVRLKLVASKNLFDTAKAATKKQSNANALESARHWQSINECRSAVREYQSFINLSQDIPEEEAKEAYLSLARCYKAGSAGNRAFRFYRLYISAYLTSKERKEDVMVMALKDLIDITTQTSILSAEEVRKLISSLSVIADQKVHSAKVKLWSAKLAERFGYSKTAAKWYKAIYEDPELTDNSTKMLAYYYDSLMNFANGSAEQARTLLKKAIEIAKDSTDTSIYLTIARMYVYEQKYETAMEYYQKITEKSPDYNEALYEMTFVALRLENIDLALKSVAKFQEKFPKSPEAITLNNISAYLHLQSGDIKLTEEKLRSMDKKYDSLSQWIRTNFAYLDSVPQMAVDKLLEQTSGFIETTSSIKIANDIFQRLSRNDNELAEGRNDLRRLIFVLGRSNLEQLKPHWTQKTKELKNLALDVLGAAHRLVASELNFLKDQMDEHDRKRIENNMKKRMEMYGEKSMNRFRKGHWVRWYNFEKATESLNERITALLEAKAKLAANKRLIENDKESLAFLKTMNSQLDSRLSSIEAHALRGRELARKAQIGIKLDLAELPAFKKFFLGYANSIYDEVKTMESYREADSRFAQGELKKKFATAWQEWEYVAQLMFQTINRFELDAINELKLQIKDLDELLVRYERVNSRLQNTRSNVEQLLARNIKNIVRQYEFDISERRSRVKKWSGDLRWLGFDSAKSGEEKLQKKYLLEKELLNESL